MLRHAYTLTRLCTFLQEDMGYSALIAACLCGFVDVVRELLKHGADIDYQDQV